MKHYPFDLHVEDIRRWVGNAPTFLELGSHEGSHTRKFLDAMVGIRLFCFEPEQRAVVRFKQAIRDDPRVTLYECAVGDIDGEISFYASTGAAGGRADWDFSGSLHPPTGHLARSPEIRFKPPVRVPCMRLDTWLSETPEVEAIDFIWADLQGAQRDLIAGGHRTLAITRYLYLECHATPLYEGEPTHDELIEELNAALNFHALAVYAGDNILFKNRNLP